MAEAEDLTQEVSLLRSKFQEKYAAEIEQNEYAACDVDRLSTDDTYAQRFILHQKKDVDKAVAMADVSLKWRKTMGLNQLTDQSFPQWFHQLGACFYYKTDKNAHTILHFCVAKNKKDPAHSLAAKQFIAWWIDKTYRKTPDKPIVLLMDMTNTGISNMDIELIKFQVTCFTTYFPAYLEYMLIYEMPWVLNAIWKIIKNLLTEEQQKRVLFVKKAEMPKYIHLDDLFTHMGGKDPYQYSYQPAEDSAVATHSPGPTSAGETTDSNTSAGESTLLKSSSSLQGINGLCDSTDSMSRHHSMDDIMLPQHATDNHFSPHTHTQGTCLRKRVTFAETPVEDDEDNQLAEREVESEDISALPMFRGTIISISPPDQFVFNVTDEERETLDILRIVNTHSANIAFKVKTTSPDNYRVRPSTSIIRPGEVATINVYLQPGAYDNVAKDKFLIMAMEVSESVENAADVSSRWKVRPAENLYMEHRLYCMMKHVRFEDNVKPRSAGDIGADITEIRTKDSLGTAKLPSSLVRAQLSQQQQKQKLLAATTHNGEIQKQHEEFVDMMLEQQVQLEKNMSWMFKAFTGFVVLMVVIMAVFVFVYAYQVIHADKMLRDCQEGA